MASAGRARYAGNATTTRGILMTFVLMTFVLMTFVAGCRQRRHSCQPGPLFKPTFQAHSGQATRTRLSVRRGFMSLVHLHRCIRRPKIDDEKQGVHPVRAVASLIAQ
jgi:hypothetical protein